jgi:hypothetical protein
MAGAATAAIGRLTRKIVRQPTLSTSNPPRTGPPAMPTLEMPPQAARATRRSRPAGNMWVIRASEQGIRRAAPSPCTARAAIRTAIVGAAAHPALATPKTPRPIRKARLAPIRSDQAPIVSRKVAKTSV